MNNKLTDAELKLAHELAELYYQIDNNCRNISIIDKNRLYAAANKNPQIHYKARMLNKQSYKKKRGY